MSLVIVGSVAYDGLEDARGKRGARAGRRGHLYRAVGAVFHAGEHRGDCGRRFRAADYDLLPVAAEIGLEGLERVPGKTFFWAGVYSDDMNDRTTLTTELNVFAGLRSEAARRAIRTRRT
jgi:hypothetical protein